MRERTDSERLDWLLQYRIDELRAIPATLRMSKFEHIRAVAALQPHGTRSRYVAGRCRCDPCRAANNSYEKRRNKLRRTFDFNGLVPADRSRKHLESLSAEGVGRHSVAAVTGLSESILFGIIKGTRRNCSTRNERKILAVEADLARGGRALVDASDTWRKLDSLIGLGYTKTFLAAQLGRKGNPPQIQLRRDRITWANAVDVKKLVCRIEQGKVARP